MLAVTALRSSTNGDRAGDVGGAANQLPASDDFSVDFDFDLTELLAGFDDSDLLPGLQIDDIDLPGTDTSAVEVEASCAGRDSQQEEREEEMALTNHEEVLSYEIKEETSAASESNSSAETPPEKDRARKSTAGQAKGSNGKRKVDWTAELHRRFVQAVEQLGVEKAVPSRILELMGIDCLTRHNVASHLQKYRSHRKHMMAREAETTSSSQRRQLYATWLPPAMGFPPNAPLPPPHPQHLHLHPNMQHFRPLHVWGHPTMNQSLVHMWPKHIVPIGPAPNPPWVAPHPIQPSLLPPHASPWPAHFARGTLSQGTPYFPQPLQTMRFPALPVPGIPPLHTYMPDSAIPAAMAQPPPPCKQTGRLVQLDAHPSKESIDAALGDVLAQPWLPLPLGLKPPSLESVMAELHKQGIANVPPCS